MHPENEPGVFYGVRTELKKKIEMRPKFLYKGFTYERQTKKKT